MINAYNTALARYISANSHIAAVIISCAKFKDRKSLSVFVKKLSTIPNVENTTTHIVLNTIKEETLVFEGNAEKAILGFPQNVNIYHDCT